jgi:hypothetical protein
LTAALLVSIAALPAELPALMGSPSRLADVGLGCHCLEPGVCSTQIARDASRSRAIVVL